MSARPTYLTDGLYDYLLTTSLREPAVLRRLRAETAALPQAGMQIAPDQGQFMALLVEFAAELEAELGKPVTSSNHAMAWHCLRLAGIDDPQPGLGSPFTLPLRG